MKEISIKSNYEIPIGLEEHLTELMGGFDLRFCYRVLYKGETELIYRDSKDADDSSLTHDIYCEEVCLD